MCNSARVMSSTCRFLGYVTLAMTKFTPMTLMALIYRMLILVDLAFIYAMNGAKVFTVHVYADL